MHPDNYYNYSTEWQPYIGYDKFEYDIKLKDGRLICNNYPNAGKFNSIDPKYKNVGAGVFSEKDVVEIRFTPFDKQKFGINPDELYGIEAPTDERSVATDASSEPPAPASKE